MGPLVVDEGGDVGERDSTGETDGRGHESLAGGVGRRSPSLTADVASQWCRQRPVKPWRRLLALQGGGRMSPPSPPRVRAQRSVRAAGSAFEGRLRLRIGHQHGAPEPSD